MTRFEDWVREGAFSGAPKYPYHIHECRQCDRWQPCMGREVNGACEEFEGVCEECEAGR